MNERERYIRRVLDEVHISEKDASRLVRDLETHFDDGAEAGESEEEIARRLGSPREIARAFLEEVPFRYAGFWVRVVAFAADVGVAAMAVLPLWAGVGLVASTAPGDATPFLIVVAIPTFLWTLAVGLFYLPLVEHLYGKTLGKHLLGLRVLDEDGTRITLGKAFIRRLSLYFEFLPLDALFVPFSAKKQRAFDVVAKTIVVRERERIGWANLVSALALFALPLALLVGAAAVFSA
ncbi:MAG: RDD family protein [Thermoanaerobaculia bacterium]|nr:RDD family protein [Thermoanaerobaculia bacterium]